MSLFSPLFRSLSSKRTYSQISDFLWCCLDSTSCILRFCFTRSSARFGGDKMLHLSFYFSLGPWQSHSRMVLLPSTMPTFPLYPLAGHNLEHRRHNDYSYVISLHDFSIRLLPHISAELHHCCHVDFLFDASSAFFDWFVIGIVRVYALFLRSFAFTLPSCSLRFVSCRTSSRIGLFLESRLGLSILHRVSGDVKCVRSSHPVVSPHHIILCGGGMA